MKAIKIVPLAMMLFLLPSASPARQSVFRIDFNHDTIGPYTRVQMNADFNQPDWSDGVDEGLAEIVDTPCGKALRVNYRAGEIGGGVKIPVRMPRHDSLYLAYSVWFPPGFTFVKEGKLAGICGGACNSGGHPSNGYDGWSSRIIWQANGQAAQYVYAADQKGKWGDTNLWNPGALTPGAWHFIETYVRINTPGQADGRIRSWLDGQPAFENRNVRFRDTDAFAIDRFVFETFFGGGTPDFAPHSNQYALFKDIRLSIKRISPPVCREG